MIWFIIGVAIAAWWIVCGWRDDWFFETIVGHVLADIGKVIACLALSAVVCFISSFVVTAFVDDYSKEETVQEVYALSDNVGVSGNFFLGSGYVGSDLVYFYVVETENGKHVETVEREHAYIKYDDAHTITKIQYDFKNKALKWIGFSAKEDDYIFTVPNGTVTNSFEVDLG